jgi:hypothetical protein
MNYDLGLLVRMGRGVQNLGPVLNWNFDHFPNIYNENTFIIAKNNYLI